MTSDCLPHQASASSPKTTPTQRRSARRVDAISRSAWTRAAPPWAPMRSSLSRSREPRTAVHGCVRCRSGSQWLSSLARLQVPRPVPRTTTRLHWRCPLQRLHWRWRQRRCPLQRRLCPLRRRRRCRRRRPRRRPSRRCLMKSLIWPGCTGTEDTTADTMSPSPRTATQSTPPRRSWCLQGCGREASGSSASSDGIRTMCCASPHIRRGESSRPDRRRLRVEATVGPRRCSCGVLTASSW